MPANLQSLNMFDLKLQFIAPLWVYSGPTAWHFITLPQEDAEQIKFFVKTPNGFGSVRVRAQIGESVWKTSIFPDRSSNSYLLPIKAEIRKRESLSEGDRVQVSLTIDL